MFQLPRGTRDFTPEEMERRRYVEDCMRTTFKTFGYREIQTPTFETLELFTAKSGEGVVEEIYSFTDKGERELALRPELTAPVIRMYISQLQMEPKPLKLFYFGNCFRYDRPQKGRYREFWQAGCELIGTNTPEAYAELIALAFMLLQQVGVKHVHLHVGNLNILSLLFDFLGLSPENRKQVIPLIDKSQFDDVLSQLQAFNIRKEDVQRFIDILQTSDSTKIRDFLKRNLLAEHELIPVEELLALLKNSFGITDGEIKLSIVRGLDYYKGLVFEIEAPTLGAEKQLCGGGAYELVSLFGGQEVPTAGFAIGFDRTVLALEHEHFTFPTRKLDIYIIPVNETLIQKSLEIAQTLRAKGVLVDVDLLRRGVGKALKHANTIRAHKAILVGPKEIEQESVTVRDMKTGEQQVIKIIDIVSRVKNM